MALAPVNATNSAQEAFGLDFQSLLQIILTQLTFQDPLKPIDNFQFVSQLGQFAQLQQTQTLNDQLTDLLATQGSTLAVGILGKTVDVASNGGQTNFTGTIDALSFSGGQPTATVKTPGGQVISGVAFSDIVQVR